MGQAWIELSTQGCREDYTGPVLEILQLVAMTEVEKLTFVLESKISFQFYRGKIDNNNFIYSGYIAWRVLYIHKL